MSNSTLVIDGMDLLNCFSVTGVAHTAEPVASLRKTAGANVMFKEHHLILFVGENQT